MTWRWPWVSRLAYDTCQGVANRLLRERDHAEAQLVEERARYDRLAHVSLGMRKEGFVPQEPLREVPPEPTLPEPVLAAIAQRAADPAMERGLYAFARQALTTLEPTQVAQRILDGDDIEEFA